MDKSEKIAAFFFISAIILIITIFLARYEIPYKRSEPITPDLLIKHYVDKCGNPYTDTIYVYNFK